MTTNTCLPANLYFKKLFIWLLGRFYRFIFCSLMQKSHFPDIFTFRLLVDLASHTFLLGIVVVMKSSMFRIRETYFHAYHPFFFAILENNQALFNGRMKNLWKNVAEYGHFVLVPLDILNNYFFCRIYCNLSLLNVILVYSLKALLRDCESLSVPSSQHKTFLFSSVFRDDNHGVLFYWTSVFCRWPSILFHSVG